MIRSILVNVDRRPGITARLQTAVAMARANNGHLNLMVDTPISRYIMMDPLGGSVVSAQAFKQAQENDAAYAKELEAQLLREGVSFEINHSESETLDALSHAARLADLVILSRSGGLAGELALAGRTPVLALPDDVALNVPVKTACIAWDGGEESACALRQSVAMLKDCESVSVITVAEKSGGFPPTDALRYLSRHGVCAELTELPRHGTTEETLNAEVLRLGANLLVMGTYGRSRISEFLFGGVTRYFLESGKSPALFLSH